MSSSMQAAATVMPLKHPMSVAIYPTYAEAQRAVDLLADKDFPVQNLCIVGTDLKQVERVLGKLTLGKVLTQGAISGLGTGLFLGLVMMLFLTSIPQTQALFMGVVIGIGMGLLSSGLGYAMSGGRRDFQSVQAIVATRYEVLGEHSVVHQAREALGQAPLQPTPPTAWPPTPTSQQGPRKQQDQQGGGAQQ
ncbi:general stress protein [Luteococcus sp. OSA5]|uniref:general stress protein n=1 Tax=Luteococcus sp. OSA5 TaxID=3401630 RepID=UPI003B4302F8